MQRNSRITCLLLGASSYLFFAVGMNFGFGVHTEEAPVLGAAIAAIGWIIWSVALFRARPLSRSITVLLLVIALVPLALTIVAALISRKEGHYSPFVTYMFIELAAVVCATFYYRRHVAGHQDKP